MGNNNKKFKTKTFTLCDECVTVKTTVEDLVGSAINSGLTRYEAVMTIYDVLAECMSDEDRKFIMDQIEEII